MDDNVTNTAEQAAAFQKVWMDSTAKMMQAAFTVTPNSPPPEVLRQIRTGIFQALAQSWEEFMRSPEFIENMKQWMENAVTFRKMTNEFLGKVRNEAQAPSREDIGTIMLTIRHLEKRLLDRIEGLSAQVSGLNQKLRDTKPARGARTRRAARAKGRGAGSNQKAEVA